MLRKGDAMSDHQFWRITVDTNPDNCNLSCIMCEDHSPYAASRADRKEAGTLRSVMKWELLEKVIREAAAMGIRDVIPSTMGEPLLYPHFDRFLELCHELNLRLNLTTNGTFPAPEKHQNVEYWARRIVPIGSDVKISWNGASEETHSKIMRGTSLASHIDNAQRFIAERDKYSAKQYCSMTMQLTFMRNNIEEIPELLELAIKLGFDRLKGHHLWAHFPEIQDQSLRTDLVFAERWNQVVKHCESVVGSHNETAPRPFKLDNFFELSLDDLDDIAPNGACPFLGKEIWIDPAGRFNVCCAPDQQRQTLGDFGNVSEAPLQDLVNGENYNRLVGSYRQRPLCKGCNMRRPS